jgi:hypothetical protein
VPSRGGLITLRPHRRRRPTCPGEPGPGTGMRQARHDPGPAPSSSKLRRTTPIAAWSWVSRCVHVAASGGYACMRSGRCLANAEILLRSGWRYTNLTYGSAGPTWPGLES